jgi:hypothetical protein
MQLFYSLKKRMMTRGKQHNPNGTIVTLEVVDRHADKS